MPKRLTNTPPLYVKRPTYMWPRRLTFYCFILFLWIHVVGYLYFQDDVSNVFINPSKMFIKQCNDSTLDIATLNNDNIRITKTDIEIEVELDVNGDLHVDIETNYYYTSDEIDEEVNQRYCGKPKCEFLFAYYQPEQETKANIHFRSFVNLAMALNRTMVLTNVGNSRINSCQNFTFEFYYDSKALQDMFPDMKFISQRDFRNWLKERRQKPTTEHAYVLPGGNNYTMELVKPYPDILETKHCLNRFELKLDDKTVFKQFNTGPKFTRNIKSHQAFSNFLVDNLQTDVEVLLASHFIFHPLFPIDTSPIPYSNHYYEEAAKITNRIKPYVAIHWRMERAKLDKLTECAEALVEKINKLKESHNIQNVYLATDYPIAGGPTQSQTFHLLTEDHHQAIRILNSTFKIHSWVSSNIFSDLRNDETIEKEFLGAGMPGIVDKLVCMDADYFLATPEGCGRARSTYTTMIINSRNVSMQLGDKPQLKNVVERWISSSSENFTA